MARRDWYCEDVLSGNLEIRKVWEDERILAFDHPRLQAEIHDLSRFSRYVPCLRGIVTDRRSTLQPAGLCIMHAVGRRL